MSIWSAVRLIVALIVTDWVRTEYSAWSVMSSVSSLASSATWPLSFILSAISTLVDDTTSEP